MKKLYVGNLPFKANEQDLNDWIAQGGVSGAQVTLVRDQMSGQLRGFGFVEISNDEEADRAVQTLNGQEFMGRALVVNEARPREDRGGGRSGHGGGRGRDGGRSGGRGGDRGGGRNRRY